MAGATEEISRRLLKWSQEANVVQLRVEVENLSGRAAHLMTWEKWYSIAQGNSV